MGEVMRQIFEQGKKKNPIMRQLTLVTFLARTGYSFSRRKQVS
jgi:hypothetical protein